MNKKMRILAIILVLTLFISSLLVFESKLEASIVTIKSSGRGSTTAFSDGTYQTGCDNATSSVCIITIRIFQVCPSIFPYYIEFCS